LTRLCIAMLILGLDLTVQVKPMLCHGILSSGHLDKVQLRTYP
jgi:hypothetical protein